MMMMMNLTVMKKLSQYSAQHLKFILGRDIPKKGSFETLEMNSGLKRKMVIYQGVKNVNNQTMAVLSRSLKNLPLIDS